MHTPTRTPAIKETITATRKPKSNDPRVYMHGHQQQEQESIGVRVRRAGGRAEERQVLGHGSPVVGVLKTRLYNFNLESENP